MRQKNSAALELQKLSYQKTTPQQRSEIARKAGQASGAARRKKRDQRNGSTTT